MRVSATELWLIGIILGLFVLAMLFLACSMNPRELLDCSLFRCCWRNGSSSSSGGYYYSRGARRRGVNPRSRRSRHDEDDDDEEGGGDITFPTINEYVFDSQSGEAGFVAMEDDNDAEAADNNNRQPMTMNHVFPDLLAENGEE
mmetsp:Transcript_26393/g.64304  ORF Transcript_26393/g.64304 Transcript_26393/m.64304 type:complete len:144 (+) Transcript_26393:174-605(+)|eukprot:CAMPEP_0113643254 /NCGR_PEP_ID=MMETSP0017_2-20120614/22737_1 /TAXON_ID=2856 /ORGANISM="Cylindrotheca closterium" /LENGTH=143 /DNA_ID=CAMNT_0000554747 /DNA_START=123 /DNA_END=554 /DNA_ORIENTATION=- /assembly_acc=CAM_ASM_000147